MGDGKQQSAGQGDGQGRSGGRRRRRRRGKGSGGNPQQQGQAHQQQGREAQAGGGKPRQGEQQQRGQQQQRSQHQQQKQGGKPTKQQPQQNKGMKTAEDLRKAERQRDLNKPEPPFVHVERRYGVAIYDNLQAARADIEQLAAKAQEVDQLNIVIRAEANMDDPELNAIPKVKVFAGTAWALIHDRRIQDGWYDVPR